MRAIQRAPRTLPAHALLGGDAGTLSIGWGQPPPAGGGRTLPRAQLQSCRLSAGA
jgi:hypothetical protein